MAFLSIALGCFFCVSLRIRLFDLKKAAQGGGLLGEVGERSPAGEKMRRFWHSFLTKLN